jgi:hypothetical protein
MEFEEENTGLLLKQVATPATENLFKVRTEGGKKSKQASLLHATVAKKYLWQKTEGKMYY